MIDISPWYALTGHCTLIHGFNTKPVTIVLVKHFNTLQNLDKMVKSTKKHAFLLLLSGYWYA